MLLDVQIEGRATSRGRATNWSTAEWHDAYAAARSAATTAAPAGGTETNSKVGIARTSDLDHCTETGAGSATKTKGCMMAASVSVTSFKYTVYGGFPMPRIICIHGDAGGSSPSSSFLFLPPSAPMLEDCEGFDKWLVYGKSLVSKGP